MVISEEPLKYVKYLKRGIIITRCKSHMDLKALKILATRAKLKRF
jgi:hypothetical protein